MTIKQTIAICLWAAGLVPATGVALAAGQYGPGVSDVEIKIGNTMPYSGPASALGAIGKAEAAYFAMINDQGGINGRKITFISRDDGYNPQKTAEVVRELVEQDHVLLQFGNLGTAPNTAIRTYLNENKVPQLFIATGTSKFNDPKNYPWTMPWDPSYQTEARIYARYMLKNLPDAKIAALYQDDDFGKDYYTGLREGLGNRADKMIVATQSYEITDANVDSQIVALHESGADVLLTGAIPQFAAKAIGKVYNIGWKRINLFLNSLSRSVATMQTSRPENGIHIISAFYQKNSTDPQWHDTPEYMTWLAWMKKYNSSGDVADSNNVYGYSVAQTMVAVLKASGDNLTRDNVMKQAASLHGLALPMLLPGIMISTSADDFAPIQQMQLMKFDGTNWKVIGDVMSAEEGN
jgi:branched-chain amino acid transport system substrate-binding protein